jgi:predicted amidophosphoribosyltransferase
MGAATIWLHKVRHAGAGVLDLLLPQTCSGCGAWLAGAAPTCPACAAIVRAELRRPYCGRCGRSLPTAALHGDECARCRREPFWNVAGVARVGLYVPALRHMLLDLKYRGQTRSVEYLADAMRQALAQRGWLDDIDALAPVPMHWLRRWQRPCDHARVLTRALAGRLRRPIVRLVRRTRHGPSQTDQGSRAARFENVRGCFGPPRSWWPWGRRRVDGQTICIVDNLLVSGATITEVSKVLRSAGARRIYALVVARPPAPGDPPAAVTTSPGWAGPD